MLPFPILLLLLFSATILAPSPHVLIGFVRTATLQSLTWSTLPTSIPSSASLLHPEETPELPVLVSQVLDASPTCCDPSPVHVAPSNTIPHSLVHPTGDRTTSTVVLLVVSLAVFTCTVYKLLVNGPNGSHTEGNSEQPTVSPGSTLEASPSQELTCYNKPLVDEIPHPFLSFGTAKLVSEPLEHPLAVTSPFPSFEITILPPSSGPFEQPSPFLHILPRELSLHDSEKSPDGDTSLATVPASDSTSIDFPSVSTTPSTDFEALTTPVVSAVEIDGSKVEPPRLTLLDTESGKEETPTRLDLLSIPHSREPEPKSDLHDDHACPPGIEDVCEFDDDEQAVFCHQSRESESDGEETFDYKGVNWIPDTPGTPPAHAPEDQALLSDHLCPPLGLHLDQNFDLSPLSAMSTINTRDVSPRTLLPPDVTPKPAMTKCATRYALDDIQVGIKNQSEGKVTAITRCASADDLGGAFETIKTTNAVTTSDGHSAHPRRDITDNETAHLQITSLRADAPIFQPRSSGMDKVVLLELHRPGSVGLKPSIHAPRNEGGVGVSESMHAIRRACAPATTSEATSDSLEPSVEVGGSQESVVQEPKSSGSAEPVRSILPGVTSGLYASIHAPQHSSTGDYHVVDDSKEKLKKQPTHAMVGSSPTDNGTQRGLTASVHAPDGDIPNQAASQCSYKHSSDAPNWAAAARAQVSSTASRGGFSAQRRNTPDPDASEPSTSTRCAAKDQEPEEGSVDNSDGSFDHADELESTAGPVETDNGLDEADDPNEQDSTTPLRRTRRRGKPRRPRQKVPYVPPPRMQNLTQHPIVDVLAAQARNTLAAPPAASSWQYYTHAYPPPPHHPPSAPGPMLGPNGTITSQPGQHPYYYHSGPTHMATHCPPPVSGFQLPGPHHSMFYPHNRPHPQRLLSPRPPLYGR